MANELFNAAPHPSPKEFEAVRAKAASNVWVSATAFAAAVTQVKQSTFAQNNLYWLNLANSQVITFADFVVTFKAGSPLTTQRQNFVFAGGYSGNVTTPFGVPFWGGNPILGEATLTVTTNHGVAGTYHFTVVA
jgi:hypothetical protein